MLNLSGKKALITGAAGGIGGEIASLYHKQGAELILTDLNAEALEKRAAELGGNVHTLTCNLGDTAEIEALTKKINTDFGGVDILVNNAGLTKDGLMLRMREADWDLVLRVNLTASFHLTRTLMRPMLKKRWGRIVNIASIVGVTGNPGQANYGASKAGMIGMTKCLAQEIAIKNVNANCIAPGFIRTPMTDALNDEQKQALISKIPSGRLGEAVDVANAALFLASEESAYITGQTINLNGGMAMI
ncbi:MAG: 3-oxoacyl-[acyl-carrier-protein] reductase [Alphaproteobacteria bacterium]